MADQAVFLSELLGCCLKHEAPWSQRDFLFHKHLNLASCSCPFETLCWLEFCLSQEYSSRHSLASWCSHLQSYEMAPLVLLLFSAQLKLGETTSPSNCCLFCILRLLSAVHVLCSFSYPLACIPHRMNVCHFWSW